MFDKSRLESRLISLDESIARNQLEIYLYSLTADELAALAAGVDKLLESKRAVLGPNRRTRLREGYAEILNELRRRQLRLL